MPRVFISYVRENSKDVERLVHVLTKSGVEVWFDRTHLKPGDRWADVIRREISQGDFFISCFSPAYMSRTKGFVFEELTQAVEQIRRRPHDERWFIPVLLAPCELPDRPIGPGQTLRDFHWVALYENWDVGIQRILDVIQPTPERLTFEPEPEMILIPAGEFLMGSDPEHDKQAAKEEQPQHTLYLPDYYLAKTPVTNYQYHAFVQAANHEPPEHWTDGKPPQDKEDHPVVWVTWYNALDYCRWLSEVTGKSYCLPSEAEWEKGARGIDRRIYPWGDRWDASRCNSNKGAQQDTTPVDAYPEGASPYGLLDMAGNVFEWTQSLEGAYPYPSAEAERAQRENLQASDDKPRVLRGGNFFFYQWYVRCACRYRNYPNFWNLSVGFRVVVLP